MKKSMRLFFLVIHCKSKHIECLIGELCVWKNLYMLCVMKLTLSFKKVLWKMKMQDFRIRILLLKMKPKLKSLNKAKKSLPRLLKTSQENEELKETFPWTTLLEKYQREYLLTLDSAFHAITWLSFLRLNQGT